MTTTEIRTLLHACIDHLSEPQLKELQDIMDEKFALQQSLKKKRQPGTMKGKIWMADNWDAEETNQEIADLFNNGDLFPKTGQ